jgi:hypothetical protein
VRDLLHVADGVSALRADDPGEDAALVPKAAVTVRRRLAATLRAFLADAGRIHLTYDDALAVALSEDLPAVLVWLTRSDLKRPRVLGRPHEIGATRDTCIHCGALAGRAIAADYGVQRFVMGDMVGRDCTPPKRRRRR